MDMEFISAVEGCPFLYDRRHPKYKNKNLKEEKWKTIGDVFGVTGDTAKKRFKGLREKYFREKRAEDSGKPNCIKWPLMEKMSFVDDCYQPRRKRTNEKSKNNSNTVNAEVVYLEEFLEDSSDADNANTSPTDSPTTEGNRKRSYRTANSEHKQSSEISKPELTTQVSTLNESVPHILETLQKLTNSLAEEPPQDPRTQAINNFCKYLASEMQRLPAEETDDLKNSIMSVLFRKLSQVNGQAK